MSDISTLLHPDCISLSLQERKKPGLIHELVGLLASCGAISDAEAVEQEILEREALTSTGIGGGIAIPHCLTPMVTETVMAFGRHRKGAKFDAVDRRPVHLFFLIVGPEGGHNAHLRLLSKLSRHLHDTALQTGLLRAATAEQVVELFAQKEA